MMKVTRGWLEPYLAKNVQWWSTLPQRKMRQSESLTSLAVSLVETACWYTSEALSRRI
jgi:hypothetical protein